MSGNKAFPRPSSADVILELGTHYFTILGQVDLQSLGVIFETERRHGKEDVLAVDRLSLFLVTFLGCFDDVSFHRNKDKARPMVPGG